MIGDIVFWGTLLLILVVGSPIVYYIGKKNQEQ
jgi:hypothetical protein